VIKIFGPNGYIKNGVAKKAGFGVIEIFSDDVNSLEIKSIINKIIEKL
jgi:hypothetical protein